MKPLFKIPTAAAALLFFGLTVSCSHVEKVKKQATRVVRAVTLRPSELDMNVDITPTANRNAPVAVDVALIKDKNFWKTAPAMTAKDWFAQKSDLQRRYGKKLDVTSWEWVPGQPVPPILVSVPRFLKGAMVFANYPTPGTHSAPIPLGGNVAISLQQDDFTLVRR